MSYRSKKKLAPIAGAVALAIADWDELQRRTDKVHALWREAGPTIEPLTPDQAENLAWEITSCVALPSNTEKEKQDANARAAIRALLAWCRYDPCDNGLPHIVFRDRRVEALEAALLQVQPLAEAPPPREWVNRSWGILRKVAFIRKVSGKEASDSPNSHTVRFISLALQWVGHPAATVDAISKEFRNKPEFRKRMSE